MGKPLMSRKKYIVVPSGANWSRPHPGNMDNYLAQYGKPALESSVLLNPKGDLGLEGWEAIHL